MNDDLPLWGPQTRLAIEHFAMGGERMPIELIRAMARIKGAAAAVNARLGRLAPRKAEAIDAAASDVADGLHDAQFPLCTWQSGSGTQSHMNLNEVLATLAARRLPMNVGVHPNDDVNRGQSSNDTVPSALMLAMALLARERLWPALDRLDDGLLQHERRHATLVKLGRTHLQDAVPMTVGQEFGGWRGQVQLARRSLEAAWPLLLALPMGGTAVGTGLNTHPWFAQALCDELARRTDLPIVPAPNRFAAMAGADGIVAFHAALKGLAVSLSKLANDVRLLASGPHGGLGELRLPANEPGSSIMPGKVNPTQCEALAMVCWQVMANDLAVTLAATGGQLQLNTARPLMADSALRSLRLLPDAMDSFERHALRALQPDAGRIAALLEASLAPATALAPFVGYERAAQIVQHALQQGLPLRDAAWTFGVTPEDFDRWTRPERLLGPS